MTASRAVPAERAAVGLRTLQTPSVTWPVRTGAVPPLAEAFALRTDSLPRIEAILAPGVVVAFVPDAQGDPDGWLRSCGKTQIAAHLTQTLWQSRGIELFAWVDASSRASALSGYLEAAARLGLDDGHDAEQVAARFLGWLGSTVRPWLVVLDDVRDPADLDGLLPGGPAGRALITAAHPGVVAGWPQVVAVAVPAFSPRESMAYLYERLSTDPDQRSGGYDLAEQLGGEPSALAQAGAVMADAETGCRDYQRRFSRQRDSVQAAAGREPAATAVTWMLSADYAEELLPGGGTWPLLVLAALLDGHAIPLGVLTAPAACRYLADSGGGFPPDARRAQSALRALERSGLLSAGPVARLGDALQAAARAAAPADLLGQAARAAADALLEAWPPDHPRSAAAAQTRACAASLLRHAGDMLWEGGCHRALLAAGESLTSAGLTGPAAAWWREIAVRCERLLGGDHPDTLIAAGQLAGALLDAGQHDDAVRCARWVLEGRDRLLGPGHPAAIAARISLGRALAAAGEPGQALEILRDAAARGERAYSGRDLPALAVLEEYAAAFLAAGDAATAVRFRTRSLAGREELHGLDDAATEAAALRLADALLAAGDPRSAMRHCKRVLAARQRSGGPDDPGTLAAHAALARAYDAAGQIGDALRAHRQACEGYERTLGLDHPVTLDRRAGLAGAYYAAGQIGDAVTVLRDGIARAERALSPRDPVTRRLQRVLDGISADMAAE